MSQKTVLKNAGEQSFTLIEVIISVGMLTAVVLQMVGGQGSVFGMIDYSQRSSEAIWLAKRMMSQVEYFASYMDFKELETTSGIREQPFKFENGNELDAEYQYSIDVKEWKLPLFDLLTGGGPKKDDEEAEEKPQNPALDAGGFDSVVDSIFEGQILKVAQVEVSWPEGARRNSVALSLLLTNQKKLDEYITTKKSIWDQINKKAGGTQTPPPPPPSRLDQNGNPLPPDNVGGGGGGGPPGGGGGGPPGGGGSPGGGGRPGGSGSSGGRGSSSDPLNDNQE